MKLKENMVITKVGEDYFVVPVGHSMQNFHGLVRLNETGADIWKALAAGKTPEQIADQLVSEYEGVDLPRARNGVQKVVDVLLAEGLLEDVT